MRVVAALAALLFGAGAGAQSPPAAVRIESPSPSHEPARDESVRVRVADPHVREVVIVVNDVTTRAAVRDGEAEAPMAWIAGNNRVSVEARSRGRVARDAVTMFRQPASAPGFSATVSRLDGRPARFLHATIACNDGLSCDPERPDARVFAVIVTRDDRRVRPRELADRTSDDPGRPARVEPRVRVEVRLNAGTEREQRWVFEAWAPYTDESREVGFFEVTPAMLAP